MGNKDSLAVVMPVYNEEGAIAAVLDKWLSMLDRLDDVEYQIHVYNDGSKDKTKEILDQYEKGKENKLIVHNKPNSDMEQQFFLVIRRILEITTGFFKLIQMTRWGRSSFPIYGSGAGIMIFYLEFERVGNRFFPER